MERVLGAFEALHGSAVGVEHLGELTVATPIHSMTYTLLNPCTIGTPRNDAGSADDRAYRW